MGEPFMRKNIVDKINEAKEAGLTVYINTNATIIDEKIIPEINADKIIVSLDAFYKSTYEKIRVGGDYNTVQYNVREMILNKKNVCVQFIVTEENKDEVDLFKEYWLKNGAEVKIRNKLGWGSAIETGIEPAERNIPCPWLMRQMVILNNGLVAQCDADYDGNYCAGDVNKKTVSEIWQIELATRRVRHLFADFNFEPCKTCKDWQVGISEIYVP
jgi:radical SAM protein with 4Fe4S-binding SPASM domain